MAKFQGPRRPATALIAMAATLSMEEAVDQEALEALIDSIAGDPAERAALLSLLGSANNRSEICAILADLLAFRAARHKLEARRAADKDRAVGVWVQRVAAGAAAGVGGGMIAGALVGGPLVAAVVAIGVGGGVATAARLSLAGAERRARHRAETIESLEAGIRSIRG